VVERERKSNIYQLILKLDSFGYMSFHFFLLTVLHFVNGETEAQRNRPKVKQLTDGKNRIEPQF
jgi:hypothetical protein